MARTKGATAKPKININNPTTNKNNSDDTKEPKETKRRGRQPGQVIEREPSVYIELNKDYRIKMDKWNYTLQEKGKEKESTEEIKDDSEDKEDVGYKSIGYYPPRIEGIELICKRLISELTIKKARKELIITMERYLELFDKSVKEVQKMFSPHEYSLVKKG